MDLLSEVIYTKNTWIGIFEELQKEKPDGYKDFFSEFFDHSTAVLYFDKIPIGEVEEYVARNLAPLFSRIWSLMFLNFGRNFVSGYDGSGILQEFRPILQ